MTPFTFNFGSWLPDVANQGIVIDAREGSASMPLADCLNVYYADGQYKSLPTAASVNAGATYLTGAPLGAYTALDPGGNPAIQVGTATALFNLSNPISQQFVGFGATYAATQWTFCQNGPQMFATDASPLCTDGLLTWGFENDPTVTVVSGAPASNTVASVGQFVMVGDLGTLIPTFVIGTGDGTTLHFTATSTNYPIRPGSVRIYINGVLVGSDTTYGNLIGANLANSTILYDTGLITLNFIVAPLNTVEISAGLVQAFPNRVQWSAIGNPPNWPVPLTDAAIAAQSGFQDNDSDLGRVMGIAGYPLYCLIFQQSGIQLAQYVGGDVVFSFGAFERKRGLVARGAFVQVSRNVYFLAEDGFFVTDGANVTPIGTASDNSAGIDSWFWSNVNKANLSLITASYDATLRCVVFAVPMFGGPINTLLIYNPLSGKWTKAPIAAQLIWSDTDGVRHKVGLFSNLSGSNYYYQSLTGIPAQAYLETCDAIFDDGNIRYTMGAIPNIDCTDVPLTMIGTRPNLSRPVNYSTYAAQDQFTTVAPFMRHGRYTRARVASNNANAINGVTLLQEMGGGM